jgi:hypothetical protein
MTTLRWIAVLTSLGVTLGYGLERSRVRGAGSDSARGRNIHSPWRMQWLGWKDVLARTWSESWDDRLLSVAAERNQSRPHAFNQYGAPVRSRL